ncbi:hypothetical protein KAR91_44635 [Candidatus Pacearchaeota archaeon]|nr:hypothetical protein [Candidatus Pacearchaeota archaeon]
MKLCTHPGCDKPKHGKGPISGKDLCAGHYKAEYRQQKSRDKDSGQKSGQVETTTVPEIGRSVTQGKGEIITQHNAAFKYEILGDYELDRDTWEKKSNGRYVNKRIKDALGFNYDPHKHKGKKPPFSVVKGCREDNRFIEIYINLDLTDPQMKALLWEIKTKLEDDLNATLKGPIDIEWQQGPEKGQPRRDFTVPSPFVEYLGQKAPELVGHQADLRPEDEHDNTKMGDGSHPKHMEGNSREQANINLSIHNDVDAYDEELTIEEATDELSKGANNIKQTKKKVETIKEKADLHELSEGNISAAILRNVKEGKETTDIILNKVAYALDRASSNIEYQSEVTKGQTEVMETFTRENASHVKVMQDGAITSDALVKAAEGLLQAKDALVDVARDLKEARPKRYERLYKRKR